MGARNSVSANTGFRIQSLLLVTSTLLVKKTTLGKVKYALGCKIIKEISLSSFTLQRILVGLGMFGMEGGFVLLVTESFGIPVWLVWFNRSRYCSKPKTGKVFKTHQAYISGTIVRYLEIVNEIIGPLEGWRMSLGLHTVLQLVSQLNFSYVSMMMVCMWSKRVDTGQQVEASLIPFLYCLKNHLTDILSDDLQTGLTAF